MAHCLWPEPRKKDMSLSKVILPKTDTQFMRHDTRQIGFKEKVQGSGFRGSEVKQPELPSILMNS
jgi:hypothetical protein